MTRMLDVFRNLPRVLGIWLALGATPLGWAGDLHAQDATALSRVRAGLAADDLRAFDQILVQATERGLPTEPLVNKALYGLARNIPAPQLLTVLRQDLQNLDSARGLLAGVRHTGADLESVADALRQGIPEPALRNLARSPRAEASVAMTVRTLADLVAIGVPVDRSLDLLEVSRGRAAAELLELPAAVDRLIRQGMVPDAAAEAVGATLTGRGVAPTTGGRTRGGF